MFGPKQSITACLLATKYFFSFLCEGCPQPCFLAFKGSLQHRTKGYTLFCRAETNSDGVKKTQLPTLSVTNGHPRRPFAQSQRRHIGARRREPECPAGLPGFMLHTSTSWSRLVQLLHHMEVMGPLITTVLSY